MCFSFKPHGQVRLFHDNNGGGVDKETRTRARAHPETRKITPMVKKKMEKTFWVGRRKRMQSKGPSPSPPSFPSLPCVFCVETVIFHARTARWAIALTVNAMKTAHEYEARDGEGGDGAVEGRCSGGGGARHCRDALEMEKHKQEAARGREGRGLGPFSGVRAIRACNVTTPSCARVQGVMWWESYTRQWRRPRTRKTLFNLVKESAILVLYM